MSTEVINVGGYDHHFINTVPDRLICAICLYPSRNPQMSVCCGHVFCKDCLKAAQETHTFAIKCPVCCNENFKSFPNKQADRDIRSLHVLCSNKEKGCKWQGELNDIIRHECDGCQFRDIKCPNQCGKMLQQRYLISHVETECSHRKVKCQYCHITGEHQFIEREHVTQCPKVLLPCPNGCNVGNLFREDVQAHRKECPLEMIHCDFYSIGCREKVMRRDMERHKQNCINEHLLLATRLVREQQEDNKRLTTTLSTVLKDLSATEGELTQAKQELMKLRTFTGTIEKDCSATKLELASIKQELIELRSLAIDYKVKDENLQAKNTVAAQKRVQQLEKQLMGATPGPIKYHTWMHTLHTTSMTGEEICPVVIRVPQFSSRMRDKGRWYSNPFYTHCRGYMMCLRVEVAGAGSCRDVYLSAYLRLMKGRNDDLLPWPLKGEFRIKLLNQLIDEGHHSHIVEFTSSSGDRVSPTIFMAYDGPGCKTFISHADIMKATPTCQYVKDDCAFIRVSALKLR